MSETGTLGAWLHDGYGCTVYESVMVLVALLSMLKLRSRHLFSRRFASLVQVVHLSLQSLYQILEVSITMLTSLFRSVHSINDSIGSLGCLARFFCYFCFLFLCTSRWYLRTEGQLGMWNMMGEYGRKSK